MNSKNKLIIELPENIWEDIIEALSIAANVSIEHDNYNRFMGSSRIVNIERMLVSNGAKKYRRDETYYKRYMASKEPIKKQIVNSKLTIDKLETLNEPTFQRNAFKIF